MTHAHKKIHCKKCGQCCSYFCIEIDTPDKRSDFDDLAWIVAHKNVSYHVEKNGWTMMVKNKCKYFSKSLGCLIYDHRPKICRNHDPMDCDHNILSEKEYEDVDHVLDSMDKIYKYRDSHFPIKRKKTRKKS